MPNTKISALPSATTPLAGTETLPIVQSSATRQVSVANLTAGRSISASGVTVTGLTVSKPVFTDGSSNLSSSGTVPTNQGGTGLTSFTQYGVFYASDTSTVAQTTNFKWQSSSLALNAGANAPGYTLEVVGTARWADTFAANGYEISPGSTNIITSYNRTTGTWLTLRQRANTHEFYTAGSEAVRIDASQYTYLLAAATTASAANMFLDTATTPSGQIKRSTSSLRYKKNVQDATHGLAEVLKLRSVTYQGINDGVKMFGGLIAEEVDAIGLSEFVSYDDQNRPDALHYGNMIALLVKAIQEQQEQINKLQTRIV